MSCDPLVNPACIVSKLVPPVMGTLTGGVLDGIASAISEGIRWIVVNTATWWIQIPSPNLANEPAVVRIQAWLFPITAVIAAGGVIAAGLRMALTRRASPLLDVSGGLLSLAAAITLGVIIPALLLKAGDAWSSWVLNASTGGHFTQRLTAILDLGGSKAAAAVVVVFGIAAMIVALVQAVLMLFRQIALIILAGVLPIAAAGTVAPITRPWIRRITSWMLALICYKPAAAAVYAAAFTLIGSGGGTRTVLLGFVTLLLSVIMLPALMKLFTWATGSIANLGGGGGQILGAAAYGAVAVGAMRSGSGSGAASAAQDQASYLDSRLGPPPGNSPPPAPPSPPSGPGGGPSGAAPPAASPAAPTGPAPSSARPTQSSAPTGAASAAQAHRRDRLQRSRSHRSRRRLGSISGHHDRRRRKRGDRRGSGGRPGRSGSRRHVAGRPSRRPHHSTAR
jgi:hypothetical protein